MNQQPTGKGSFLRRICTRPGLWISALLLCVCLVFTLLTFLLPKADFSEKENRALAQAPALRVESLRDGSFMRGAEKYFADHFFGRDFWTGLNLRRLTALRQKESGGVYLGRHKQLYLIPGAANEAALSRNLEAMEAFAKRGAGVRSFAAIIPNAVSVQPKHLPRNAPVPDQAAQLAEIAAKLPSISWIDTLPALREHADEYLYYMTDHHWTSFGASVAFQAMAPQMQLTPAADYDIYEVSSQFRGTLAAKSGRTNAKDRVELYVPKTQVDYYVTYTESAKKAGSMYEPSALESRDHYTVFFGGNHPRVDIMTTAETGRTLLVFKDSYANCMMQFLYPCFDKIIMIDPRYYYDSAETLLQQNRITDVLYLYNLDTFLSDTSLADVLAAPAAPAGNPQTAAGETISGNEAQQ